MTSAIAVFLAMFALDFVWARYTLAMTAKRAAMASNLAAGIIVLSGAAQIGYTSNWLLLIPAALGAWAGTFVAIKAHG